MTRNAIPLWKRGASKPAAPVFGHRNSYLLAAPPAILAGFAAVAIAARGQIWLPFAFLSILAIYGLILSNWRLGIYALVAFLPFAGLPTILLYTAPPAATLLLKDLLFVVPVYLGFVWEYVKRSPKPFLFPGAPTIPLAALTVMLILQFFNPALGNLLVGLIGFKVWLFYIPLLFLGYQFVDSQQRLLRLAQVMLLAGLIPVLIGIVEAILIYSRRAELVYSLYGPAAYAVTQGFTAFTIGLGQSLVRIPSTFTSSLQYITFLYSLLPIAYGLWLSTAQSRQPRSWAYLIGLGLVVIAALTSGVRAAFVLVPLYFMLVILLSGNLRQVWKPLLALAAGFVLIAAMVNVSLGDLFNFISQVTQLYAGTDDVSILNQFNRALDITWIGLGPGMSTTPARYAFPSADDASVLAVIENYYGKAIVEIGVLGLVLLVLLFAQIVLTGFKSLARVQDRVRRPFAVGMLAFLLLELIYLFKGSILDFDPTNVLFWLYAGILLKLPHLEEPLTQKPEPSPDET